MTRRFTAPLVALAALCAACGDDPAGEADVGASSDTADTADTAATADTGTDSTHIDAGDTPPIIECVEPEGCAVRGIVDRLQPTFSTAGAVDGETAYIVGYSGSDAVVEIIDVSSGVGELVGTTRSPGFPTWTQSIAPDLLYTGVVTPGEEDGVVVVVTDVSDPSSPIEIARVPAPGFHASGLPCVDGALMLSWEHEGYRVLDATNPRAPTVGGLTELTGVNARSCAISGSTAILFGAVGGEMGSQTPVGRIIDLADPSAPVERGLFRLTSRAEGSLGVHGSLVDPTTAVIIVESGRTATLETWDITDPADATLLGRLEFEYLVRGGRLLIDGDTALLVNGQGSHRFSLADREAPTLERALSWDFPETALIGAQIDDGLLRALSFASLIELSEDGEVEVTSLGRGSAAAVTPAAALVDTIAYLPAGEGGLTLWETCDPLNPTRIGHVIEDGYVNELVHSDRWVVARDTDAGTLEVLDASNPAAPVRIATLSEQPDSFAIAGDLLVLFQASELIVFDMLSATPEAAIGSVMIELDSESERPITLLGDATRVLVMDQAEERDGGYTEVDLSDPTNPVLLRMTNVQGGAEWESQFRLQGDFLYVWTTQELIRHTISTSEDLFIETPGLDPESAWDIDGDLAVFVNSHNLRALRIEGGGTREVAFLETTSGAGPAVSLEGGRAVLTASSHEVVVFDLTCP